MNWFIKSVTPCGCTVKSSGDAMFSMIQGRKLILAVQVAALAAPGALVEIEVIAAKSH